MSTMSSSIDGKGFELLDGGGRSISGFNLQEKIQLIFLVFSPIQYGSEYYLFIIASVPQTADFSFYLFWVFSYVWVADRDPTNYSYIGYICIQFIVVHCYVAFADAVRLVQLVFFFPSCPRFRGPGVHPWRTGFAFIRYRWSEDLRQRFRSTGPEDTDSFCAGKFLVFLFVNHHYCSCLRMVCIRNYF